MTAHVAFGLGLGCVGSVLMHLGLFGLVLWYTVGSKESQIIMLTHVWVAGNEQSFIFFSSSYRTTSEQGICFVGWVTYYCVSV